METITAYRECWEEQEKASLISDRDRKLELMGIEVEEGAEAEEAQRMTEAHDGIELD